MEPQQPSRWARFSAKTHAFLRDDRGVRYFFIALAVIIVGGIGLLVILRPANTIFADLTFLPRPPEPQKQYSPLTGVEIRDTKNLKRPVTAIMIENSPDARPQSGLKEAGIVFEAIAEGGITRFLALYQEGKPKLIGPVRSLRPYYLHWGAAFDPSIVHVGGSAAALREVRDGSYKDLDQFFNGGSFWRATDRVAPHNVYTTMQRLDELNKQKNFTNSKFSGFLRQKVATSNKEKERRKKLPKATKIHIPVSSETYSPHYRYIPEKGIYLRSQGSEPHNDREKGRIAPKVVIAMKTVTKIGWEDGYREQMRVVGRGDAVIFQQGTAIKAKWHKHSKTSQITFTDLNDQPIRLARGQTWITVTPTDRKISWQ